MKFRALAVAGLLVLTVSGVASSKSPRLTLASLALQEFSIPDQSATSQTKVKSGSVPEINIEIKQPAGKNSKRANYDDDYYASRGYITTTVTAAAPDLCLSSSAMTIRREKRHDKAVVYGQSKQAITYLFHGERVMTQGNTTYLSSRSYALDAAKGQVEVVRDNKVSLTPVASREDLRVYVFRGPRELHLVVSAPENSAMIGANGGASRLGCGLKRLSFPLSEQPDLALSFALGFAEKDAKPSEAGGFHGSQPMPLDEALRVSASVSQTSRDPSPVLSVTIAPTNKTIRTTLEQQMPRWNEILTAEELASLDSKRSLKR
jgi:hypothetical protein